VKKPKVEKDFKKTMQQTGFSADTAKKQEAFWDRMGVTGIQIGRTVLKIKGKNLQK
jgi:hypothetical protein